MSTQSNEASPGAVASAGDPAGEALQISPGLLELEPGGEGALLGSRCPSCGASFFPHRQVCSRCLHEPLERVPLSSRGTVYTYTVIRQAPPGFEVPYVLVYVDLPEGVRVLGQLAGATAESVRIGMEVELSVEPFRVDAEGREVIGYRFHPAQEGET